RRFLFSLSLPASLPFFWVVFGSILAFAGIFFGGTLGLLIFGLMGDTDSDQESVARADAGAEVAESAAASYAGNDSVDRMLQRAADRKSTRLNSSHVSIS